MAHWRASGDMTARDIVQKITDEEEAGTSIIPPYVESAGLKRHIPSVFIGRDFGGSGAAAEGRKSIPPSKGFGFAEFTHHAHQELKLEAVSYTHLTLPTILLV